MKIKISKNLENKNLTSLAFWQAVGLAVYCGLVGMIFWQGDRWFGKMDNLLGPLLLLTLLVVSVLICALIGLGYPFLLFWEEKKPKKALRLVAYTSGWLASFVLLIMILLLIF